MTGRAAAGARGSLPPEPAEPALARLSRLDRFLPVWILAAMVLGLRWDA